MADKTTILHQLSTISTKLIFTIIIGLLFFMYQVDTIQKDDRNENHGAGQLLSETTQPIILPSEISALVSNIQNNTGTYTSEEITSNYKNLCLQTPRICAHIQAQINDSIEKQLSLFLTIYTIQILDNQLSPESQKLRDTIESIIIKREPDGKRGYANHFAVVVNNADMSRGEYMEVLTHELGHIIDLGITQGQDEELDEQFTEFNEKRFKKDDPSLAYYTLSRESEGKRKSGQKKEEFCSIYGMSNPFEDFAECFNLYIHHQDYFIHLASENQILQKKYSILDTLLENNTSLSYNLDRYNIDGHYRYWDTTKIITY